MGASCRGQYTLHILCLSVYLSNGIPFIVAVVIIVIKNDCCQQQSYRLCVVSTNLDDGTSNSNPLPVAKKTSTSIALTVRDGPSALPLP